eukprot:CAMPEP_0117574238 /NCGR_PEP_ID=MMETSP0784-20121206/61457_1 /TAXON_ID=39447 /ORGANISM="" /LENGTH=62 /DNA_ID=CAMNT_0005373009 /DNA_START=146 /DNA_END=331 /DNA_ORIENTATION=+
MPLESFSATDMLLHAAVRSGGVASALITTLQPSCRSTWQLAPIGGSPRRLCQNRGGPFVSRS